MVKIVATLKGPYVKVYHLIYKKIKPIIYWMGVFALMFWWQFFSFIL